LRAMSVCLYDMYNVQIVPFGNGDFE